MSFKKNVLIWTRYCSSVCSVSKSCGSQHDTVCNGSEKKNVEANMIQYVMVRNIFSQEILIMIMFLIGIVHVQFS